jgi:hypothetical protein
MASSFVSGPGVANPAADGLEQCRQSSANYPRILARRLNLSLVESRRRFTRALDVPEDAAAEQEQREDGELGVRDLALATVSVVPREDECDWEADEQREAGESLDMVELGGDRREPVSSTPAHVDHCRH